jgi:hypothetical protein
MAMPAKLPTFQRFLVAPINLLDRVDEGEFLVYAIASHAALLTCKSSSIDRECACNPLKFATLMAARNVLTRLSTNSAITFPTLPPSNAVMAQLV